MFEEFSPAPEEAVVDDGGTIADPVVDFDAIAQAEFAAEQDNARLEELYLAPDLDEWSKPPFDAIARFNPLLAAQVRARKLGPIEAVPTPFPFVNRRCLYEGGQRGYAKGWHTLIGGASNHGKSTIAMNFAVRSMRYGWNVLYLHLESNVEAMVTRLAGIAGGKPVRTLSRGKSYDFEADRDAMAVLTDLPGSLWLNRLPVPEVRDIEKVTQGLRRHFGVQVIILDHIQLAQHGDEKALAAKAAAVSEMLASVAREEHVVTIGLSQLTTNALRNTKTSPGMGDLLGGGPVIHGPDIVLMTDHSESSWVEQPKNRSTEFDLFIAKTRQGPDGRFRVRFDWKTGGTAHELDKRGGNPVGEPTSKQLETKI